jgi:polysaccharide pyruvyl transferase WcaK-like protein/chemotaxis methyl-accepting protein methylase
VEHDRLKSPKIAFFGHFGSENSGNESTLLTVLSRLGSVYPESEFLCVCTHDDVVQERYGIGAVPITTRTARIWDRTVPLARRVPMPFVGLGAELAQYGRAYRTLAASDMLIIPGTGLVNDAYGLSAWGPYNLFKWVLMAKLHRRPVLFLSVGVGPVRRTTGRLLTKAALSLADYRSYRDRSSKEYLTAIGFDADRDPIYPDLVFGLPEALLPRAGVRSDRARRVVGLGLMEYAGKYSSSDPRPETYTSYLESLAVFAAWLLEHDYDIRLLLGDSDARVIEDFTSVLRARIGGYDAARVTVPPIASVQDLLAELAATDVVVATRFHNVLLSLLLSKPVIAVSFHHKCASLMRQMKLSEYCQDIDHIDGDSLIGKFRQLERDRDAVQRTIARGVKEARAAVDEQYDQVFASPVGAGTAKRRRARHLRQRLETAFLVRNERVWRRLPARARELRPVRSYGAWLHALVCRGADREMYVGTHFLRNRAALELMRRLLQSKGRNARVKIAVLGCSIGVEVYSILWTLRSSRPDLELTVQALDISPEVIEVAQRGVYSSQASEMVSFPIFDGLTDSERDGMFDWVGDDGAIKPWLRDGITWQVGDAADPELIKRLGPQDLVIANNFLCHMPAPSAQRCLRNLAQLVTPGGHLVVTGVDLDVRTQVATQLGWEPVPELRAEIHDGDPHVRNDWPWQWWGLEPLDRRRDDWETRYSAVFRVSADT